MTSRPVPALTMATTVLLQQYAQRTTGDARNAGQIAWLRSLMREELLEALGERMFEVEAWLADHGHLLFGDSLHALGSAPRTLRPHLALVIKAGTPAYLEAAIRDYWRHAVDVGGGLVFPEDSPTISMRPPVASLIVLRRAQAGIRLSFREVLNPYCTVTAVDFCCRECGTLLPAARVRYRTAAKAHAKTPCGGCFHRKYPTRSLEQMGLNLGFWRTVELVDG